MKSSTPSQQLHPEPFVVSTWEVEKKKHSSAQFQSGLHSMKLFCQTFYEMASAPPEKSLHQKSQSWSYFQRRRVRAGAIFRGEVYTLKGKKWWEYTLRIQIEQKHECGILSIYLSLALLWIK
jgi:hypothetical protein